MKLRPEVGDLTKVYTNSRVHGLRSIGPAMVQDVEYVVMSSCRSPAVGEAHCVEKIHTREH